MASVFKRFPRTMGFGGLRSLFLLWQVVLPVCWVPRPEWYFHHGVGSAKVWWSVVTPGQLSELLPQNRKKKRVGIYPSD